MVDDPRRHDNAPGGTARRWANLDADERREALRAIVGRFADREPEPREKRRSEPRAGYAALTERERQAAHAEILAGLRARAIERADAGIDDPTTERDVDTLIGGEPR